MARMARSAKSVTERKFIGRTALIFLGFYSDSAAGLGYWNPDSDTLKGLSNKSVIRGFDSLDLDKLDDWCKDAVHEQGSFVERRLIISALVRSDGSVYIEYFLIRRD